MADDLKARARQLVDGMVAEFDPRTHHVRDFRGETCREADGASGEIKIALVEELLRRIEANTEGSGAGWSQFCWQVHRLSSFLSQKLPLPADLLCRLVNWPATDTYPIRYGLHPISEITAQVEHSCAARSITPELLNAAQRLIERLSAEGAPDRATLRLVQRLQSLTGDGPTVTLLPGEAWADAARADLSEKPKAWMELLAHCQGSAGKPTDKWQKQVAALRDAVGFDAFKAHILKWFALADKPRTDNDTRPANQYGVHDLTIIPPHVELLRGLAWCCGLSEDADLARALRQLAVSAYRKVPGVGPRLVGLGNAAVVALGMMPGRTPIGHLAVLRTKVKFGTAQKEIDKAFRATAEREGLPADEIEELAVPGYGLEEVGFAGHDFGEYRAEVRVDGSDAAVHWFKHGKPLKSAPAAAKKDHAEEIKELAGNLKDLNAMLPAQKERIDNLFLLQKTWPLAVWRERYLDHPLVGTLARRLIWTFDGAAGIWDGTRLVDASDAPLTLGGGAAVALWHPIGQTPEQVEAWRLWLGRREVTQPFKQAHREVYLLTDAERNTGTYSNRFAAHVLKQHQYHALCGVRGWKNQLRLAVDNDYPATHRLLPQWNLRAEFWVEGAGDEYTDSGAYNYLTTDQVRFYRIGAPQLYAHAGGGGYGRWRRGEDEPLPLDQIPPLVFSEIFRDVDLFVGVCSVANNPNWSDGGPNGTFRDYWHEVGFGELGVSAKTRKAILERLIPRLKIAPKCRIADRFLEVDGSLRGYRIHLGSGNILMKPNDQYLCIVPKQSAGGGQQVFLPFEGDSVLSVILSKAMMLADDAKITDPTIVSQIKR